MLYFSKNNLLGERNFSLFFSLILLMQDLCRAVTNVEWKLPKHILLCASIRHLYKSKKLINILNRLGHSESYDFGLELETAMAKAIDEVSQSITSQIVTGEANKVFHMEWDNLNQIMTNIHGNNLVNSTAGIMIQEIYPDRTNSLAASRLLRLYERQKKRSLKVDAPASLPPVCIFNRVGPTFPEAALFTPPSNQPFVKSRRIYNMWLFTRVLSSNSIQHVPAFGGFVSATGVTPGRKSTIDYFPPINQPFTDYAAIVELLRKSEEATKEVGQEYVLNTFDLGGVMKVMPIIWKSSERYRKHVITPGPFHTAMNYIGIITAHKFAGSGYAEILIEAELATSGCLSNILKGKAYAKALFCLQTVCEAMERLLVEKFTEEVQINLSDQLPLFQLITSCSRKMLEVALCDTSLMDILQKYVAYLEKVRGGHLGKTATFWMGLIDHTHLLLMLLYSVKTNHLALFHKCMGNMAELFFAYDGHNYSRYKN